MTSTFLSLKNLSKRFAGVQALDNVSMDIGRGEVVALIGANGAGKSTLMNILGGVVQKDSGSIFIDGKAIEIKSPIEAYAKGISFVHQELTSLNSLPVIDNLLLTSYPNTAGIIQARRAWNQVASIFSRLGIDFDPNEKMGNLSPGDQQLVEITRALLQDSRVVIFDEPTSSLSKKEKDRLFKIIDGLKKDGVSVIYITHLLDELQGLCERIVILRNGRVVNQGKLSDFPHKRIVNEMIGEESERVLRKKTSIYDSEPVMKVTNLNRRGVLKGINFEMHRGEILGVWGLMGSGRTELLRSLLGLDPITSGEIFYRQSGKMNRISPPALNKHVGFVTEDRRKEGLFLSMSVKINLTIASLSSLFGKVKPFINSRKEDQITSETINKLQIKVADSNQTVGTLSGGNQQKVVIGRWLLRDPDIYFLDEPIKGIDVGSKAEIKRLIGLLADQGKSILLVSSEIEELLGFCDRYIVMCRGQLTGEFPGDVTTVQLMDAATSISRVYKEGSK